MAEETQDLAQEALDSRKFALAADIYEKSISQNGPNFRTYILLGDAYAKGERLKEAVEAYCTAFRLEKLHPDHLRNFINGLLEVMKKKKEFLPNRRAAITSARSDYFTCFICHGILYEPVTIPCGHSYCRKCVSKDSSNTCKMCGVRHLALPFLNTNVSLQRLIEKLFPKETQSMTLKEEGNKIFAKGNYLKALDLYTEALALSPADHIIFGNRSNVYYKLKQYREAEIDGDNAIRIRPDWSKGYFRKAQAQVGQNKLIEAAATYLQCLLLDDSKEVKTHLAKVLITMFDPMSPMNQEIKTPRSSACHFMLVRGIEQLLNVTHKAVAQKLEAQEAEAQEAEAQEAEAQENYDEYEGAGADDSSDWSKSEQYNMLPMLPPRTGISKSLPHLPSHLPHFCSEASEFDTHMAVLGRRKFPRNKLEKEDFDCPLCLRLLWEPVTTSCGHVFCRGCLDRVTDHSTKCPLCKNDLADYVNQQLAATTGVFRRVISDFFPDAFEERRKIHEDEIAEIARVGTEDDTLIPVFVCTLGFPNITCPLHVFEPRYRLMVRQAMETGSRQFGMCMGQATNEEPFGYAVHGTMLEIQDVTYFPDGRSVVNTIGGRRFKVISRGMRDGYNTAKVEFIRDEVETEPLDVQSLTTLENRVYDMARHWFTSLPSTKQHRITSHYGPFPDRLAGVDIQSSPQGPAWAWWEIAVLPIDQLIQLRLLGCTSLRERLLTAQSLLLHFNHSMGIGPLPAQDPRSAELNEIRVNQSQGGGQSGLEFLGRSGLGSPPGLRRTPSQPQNQSTSSSNPENQQRRRSEPGDNPEDRPG